MAIMPAVTRVQNIDGLVQERNISIINALELRLPCTNTLICEYGIDITS